MLNSRLLLPVFALLAIGLVFLTPTPNSFIPTPYPELRAGIVGGTLVAFLLIAERLLTTRRSAQPTSIQEPERVYLLGSLNETVLYEAYRDDGRSHYVFGYYSTPERAFRANARDQPSVRPVKFFRVGDKYIDDISVRLRDLRVDYDVEDPT